MNLYPAHNRNCKTSFPFTEEKIRALKAGDGVLISGVVLTGCHAGCKFGD
jgi:tartrate dehydratase beta subunit/fumarate hydratase class I family protein